MFTEDFSDRAAIGAGSPPPVNLSTFAFQKDTWFPVALRIRVDSPTRGRLSIDEPATATIPSVAIPANTTALRVHCGLHYVEGPGRTTVALDDVSLLFCGPETSETWPEGGPLLMHRA